MKRNDYPLLSKNRGSSLIEVMVSGFILALGFLGLAGMQSMAVKSTVEVQQRNLANSLVMDITQRMQLNHLWLSESGHNYNIASLADAELTAPSCVAANGVFTSCSGENIKDNDLYEWKKKFTGEGINSSIAGENGLVDADACITSVSDGSKGEVVEIVISWLSTVASKDTTVGTSSTSEIRCGSQFDNTHRRQLSISTYISKST